jgi:hypothetical protein
MSLLRFIVSISFQSGSRKDAAADTEVPVLCKKIPASAGMGKIAANADRLSTVRLCSLEYDAVCAERRGNFASLFTDTVGEIIHLLDDGDIPEADRLKLCYVVFLVDRTDDTLGPQTRIVLGFIEC